MLSHPTQPPPPPPARRESASVPSAAPAPIQESLPVSGVSAQPVVGAHAPVERAVVSPDQDGTDVSACVRSDSLTVPAVLALSLLLQERSRLQHELAAAQVCIHCVDVCV
jgi:hypothetical protein